MLGNTASNSASPLRSRTVLHCMLLAAGLALCFVLCGPVALAQSKSDPEPFPSTGAKNASAPFEVPHVNVLSKMIQSHMAALSNAIVTNNFSVLRGLGTPQFQNANSPQALAQTFSPFRQNGLDISRVVIYTPILQDPPVVDGEGRLRLKGYYNTTPSRVLFDLTFLPASGKWKLDAISAFVEAPGQASERKRARLDERTIISPINMRAQPSIEGKLVANLKPGQKVHVLGVTPEGDWHSVVILPNTFGFIKSDVLEKNSK